MMTRPKCQFCNRMLRILHLGDEKYWVCQCGDSRSRRLFTEFEIKEYNSTPGNEMTFTEKAKETHLRKEEKDAKVEANIVMGLAQDVNKKAIAKENHIEARRVKAVGEKRLEEINESKEFLVQEYLDIAKKSTEIMKENEFAKLHNLDGYKLTLAGKIAADAALMLGGDNLKNVNIVNFQMLIEKVDNLKVNAERKEKDDIKQAEDAKIVDIDKIVKETKTDDQRK